MKYKKSIFNMEIPFDNGQILYNTYTGALILLQQPLDDNLIAEHQTELVNQGFFVDSRINEVNKMIIERNRELYTSRIKHLHIEIAPTLMCQAHCWYCFENTGDEKKTMDMKTASDTVEFIKERIRQSKCDEFCLLFFGGEPFLAIEQMCFIGSKIKDYCHEQKIKFHSEVISNGIAFTDIAADRIISDINMTNLQITLDGMELTHDRAKGVRCFNKVIENITSNAEKTNISIRLNVSKKNKDEIPALIEYLLEEKQLDGKVRIYLARVDDLDSCGISEDAYMDNFSFVDYRNEYIRNAVKKYKSFIAADFLPDIKRNYCGYEKISQIMIGPAGELYRCQRTLGDIKNAAGDIYTGSYYTDEELSFFRDIDPKCLSPCNLLPACFGGCPNERRKGKPISYCRLKREQIEKDIITYVKTLIDG